MNGVLNTKRDPRAEKRRDFRNHGNKCGRPRCGICHPHKRWREGKRERKRAKLSYAA